MTMVMYMSSEVDSGDDDDKHGDIHWAGHVYVTIHPVTIETDIDGQPRPLGRYHD